MSCKSGELWLPALRVVRGEFGKFQKRAVGEQSESSNMLNLFAADSRLSAITR